MKSDFLRCICCPACQGELSLIPSTERHGEIWTGTLPCTQCEAVFEIRAGMPHLYVDDARWQPKAREAQGWVEMHKQMGMYEQAADSIDLQIPYYPQEPWRGVAHSFDIALQELALSGEETVLDLGAGRGWAAKQFALWGCRVVALDIVPDDQIGLGRAHALMTHGQTYFERLIGDGENLPFQPEQFDVVFCSGALHHFADLAGVLRQIARVLRPNGRLCAMYEPCISVLDSEQESLAQHAAQELAWGINETRPNILDYRRALASAQLAVKQIVPIQGHGLDHQGLLELAQDMGAIPSFSTWWPPNRVAWRWYQFLKNRWRARLQRLGETPHLSTSTATPLQISYAILFWSEHEIFMLAQKG